mmetsp:Transcript_3562/g.3500  ORF Transcript_3562/g.3500 Transcript_3562/m.3500 type:complete len:161 (+) Transcript_3562:306-788(+)
MLPLELTPPVYDISAKPEKELEVRVVIFDTTDIAMMDVEGTSDVYCRAYFDQAKETHETDTHFRCNDGKASFNYRLVFRIWMSEIKTNDYSLTLQAFDRDFFKSNDIIGSTNINLRQAIEDCLLTQKPLGVSKTYYENYMEDECVEFEYQDENTFFVSIQ